MDDKYVAPIAQVIKLKIIYCRLYQNMTNKSQIITGIAYLFLLINKGLLET